MDAAPSFWWEGEAGRLCTELSSSCSGAHLSVATQRSPQNASSSVPSLLLGIFPTPLVCSVCAKVPQWGGAAQGCGVVSVSTSWGSSCAEGCWCWSPSPSHSWVMGTWMSPTLRESWDPSCLPGGDPGAGGSRRFLQSSTAKAVLSCLPSCEALPPLGRIPAAGSDNLTQQAE